MEKKVASIRMAGISADIQPILTTPDLPTTI
jgi:hypothetical protein